MTGMRTETGDASSWGQEHEHDRGAAEFATEVVLAGEQIDLVSTGVDIGSATSHLMLSKLVLRRRGVALSSGFEVVRREVTYRSPVILTPYVTPRTIDAELLGAFIDASYAEAGVSPSDIDTGAVIVTGEAARKRNARAISELFARHSGKFVCAVAGPLLEARLAVQGSGSANLSAEMPSRPVLNVDMGGGTTKISLLRAGRTEQTMVVNIGARLVAWSPSGAVIRVEEAGRRAAQACGVPCEIGSVLDEAQRAAIANWLADRLFDFLSGRSGDNGQLYEAGAVFEPPGNTAVVVSGGVGEYVYGHESADYGDLGMLLGAAVRQRFAAQPGRYELVPAAQRLRSTVIGASQYTVQVSGNTIYLSDPEVLPLHNLPVVHLTISEPNPTAEVVASAVRTALSGGDHHTDAMALALAFHSRFTLSYPTLSQVAKGVTDGCGEVRLTTLVVILEQDFAGLLGHLLRPITALPNVLCIDQVYVADLDYVDVGRLVEHADAVPVVAKSLIFS